MSSATSMLLRLTLSNCFSRNVNRRLCSSYNKDLTNVGSVVGSDILMQNLKHARSVSSVLDMVHAHQKIMNNKHIMQALRSLFTLQKRGSSGLSTKEILNHNDFEKLCRNLQKKSGTIDMHETIEALKVMFYLKVPPDSTIIQVLLQLIRHNINSLNLPHIMFLDFILSQQRTTPMMEALKIALPIVFEIHYEKKMDRESIAHLSEYLFYASRNKLSEKCVRDIINAISRCEDPMDLKTAKSIVWSITDLPEYDFVEPLLKEALKLVSFHIDELEFVEVESTLTKVLNRVSKKNHFYDEFFIDSCINYILDKEVGFTNVIHVLRKVTKVNHHSRSLLDHISTEIHNNPDLLLKADLLRICNIVDAVGSTDYRPVYWDTMKDCLDNFDYISKYNQRNINWLKLATSLSFLKIFNVGVLEIALRQDSLLLLFEKQFILDHLRYLTVCQSIHLYRPELQHLIPNELEPAVVVKKLRKPVNRLLQNSLHVALGGEKYVKTNMFSKCGVLLDYVVIFRRGGYAVALNVNQDEQEYIEDIDSDPDHQVVIIMELDENNFMYNNKLLRSMTAVRLQSLQAKGYSVVPVNSEIWQSLSDFEKIPYLMQAIRTNTAIDFPMSINAH